MNHPIIFLDRDYKTKLLTACFSYFFFFLFFLQNSCGRKISFNLRIVIRKKAINNRFNLAIIKKLIKLFYIHCPYKRVVNKLNKENLKVIKNTLPNKSGNPESLKK